LAQSLPSLADDVETAARRVLLYLLDPASDQVTADFGPCQCPNCGLTTSSKTSPYCSSFCREEAAFVRQFRAGVATGAVLDPIRQVGLGQNLWHLLGGGYPLRATLIKPNALAKVLARGCEACGRAAITVDHLGSG